MRQIDLENLIPSKVGGYCGVLAPFMGFGLIVMSMVIHSWFDLQEHALSELGEVGLAYNNVFNFALIISGFLFLIFALSLFRIAETEAGHIGIWGLALGAIFMILIGVFPMGTTPHLPVAILFYSTTIAGLIIFGIDEFFEFEPVYAMMIWTTLGITFITIILIYILRPEGLAIYEIVGAYPVIQFSLVFGSRLITE